jgi:hypothetical protein
MHFGFCVNKEVGVLMLSAFFYIFTIIRGVQLIEDECTVKPIVADVFLINPRWR